MKTIILEATLTDIEKMYLFDQGRRRENLGACKVDKLIRYYKVTLSRGYFSARQRIEDEFRKRNLAEFIAPMRELTSPIAGGFTLDLAQMVIDSKGDITPTIKRAEKTHMPAVTYVQAYVLAVVLNENTLAQNIKDLIIRIGTYDSYMKDYLNRCLNDTDIVQHFVSTVKSMEDYKLW